MKRCKTLMLSDIICINGHDYFVSEMNTKGTREILELDRVRPAKGEQLTVEYIHDTKSGKNIVDPILAKLKLFFCPQTNKWKLA